MYKRANFTSKDKELSENIREKLAEAEELILGIPNCRNRSLAITHLEDVMLRTNLAIAENAAQREDGGI